MTESEELVAQLRATAGSLAASDTTETAIKSEILARAEVCLWSAADSITASQATIAGLEQKHRAETIAAMERVYDNQKQAAARFGFEPGELQWAWRTGQRTDRAELEWAIVDALAMGGVGSRPGDGVGCAAQIVTYQMQRAETAEAKVTGLEAEVAGLRAALGDAERQW